jgi:hypothetical protein
MDLDKINFGSFSNMCPLRIRRWLLLFHASLFYSIDSLLYGLISLAYSRALLALDVMTAKACQDRVALVRSNFKGGATRQNLSEHQRLLSHPLSLCRRYLYAHSVH